MKLIWRGLVNLVGWTLPWPLRRVLYSKILGWNLSKNSRIGLSIILAENVSLAEGARIAHGCLISPIKTLNMEAFATIGRGTRIVGGQDSGNYAIEFERHSALFMEEHSAITRMHIIDCTNTVTIGRFSLIAGYRSQILSHSPDFSNAKQTSKSVHVGAYCFIGTGSIVLYGVNIPSHSIVSAGSVFVRSYTDSYKIYAGNPAVPVKSLTPELAFFNRKVGFLGN